MALHTTKPDLRPSTEKSSVIGTTLIGEGDAYDTAIAAGENTVPDTSTCRVDVINGIAYLAGEVAFDGADAVLNFTLPDGARPAREFKGVVAWDDGGTPATAELVIGTDGVTTVTPHAGAAFAAADTLTLSGVYRVA